MLKKTYLFVKQKMFESVNHVLDEKLPFRETLAAIMRRLVAHLLENKAYFLFSEQFDNSPFIEKLSLKDHASSSLDMYHDFFEDAKAKGILQNADTSLLIAYCYYPVIYLVKSSMSCGSDVTEELIQQTINLSWKAIKA